MCKTTLTKKVAHQIRKTFFGFSKLTPDSQNSLRILKTYTKFVKVTPNLGSSQRIWEGPVERRLGHLSPAFGSSRIASSAHQKVPSEPRLLQFRSSCRLGRVGKSVTNKESLALPDHTGQKWQKKKSRKFGGNQELDGSMSLSLT